MVDRVQPLVWESTSDGGSSDEQFHKEIDKNEDALDARGLYIQNDTSTDDTVMVSRDNSNNLTFKDGVVTGTKTLTDLLAGGSGGISETDHRLLDQLVHGLDENFYGEYSYSANKITNINIYTDSSKATKIRDYAYTYNGNKINTEIVKQYDNSNTLVETLNFTYNYTGFRITSVDCTRS